MIFITKKKILDLLPYLISLFFIFALWSFLSFLVKSDLILPPPLKVFRTLFLLLKTQKFWISLFFTFLRILISVLISMILGSLIGILTANFKFFDRFFAIPLGIFRSVPVAAFILAAFFWFNSDFLPVFACVLMTLPVMAGSVKGGILSTPSQMLFLAKCHNFGFVKTVRYFQWPYAKSSFLEGLYQVFAMSWKVISACEILCLPKYAVGSLMQKSQIHLETSEVIAQTIALVFFSMIFQILLQKIIKMTKNQN